MFEDINIDEILDKIDYGDKPSGLAAMISLLDPEHGLVIDAKIGLLGEFKDKSSDNNFKSQVGYPLANRELEKRGDYFEVVSELGEILLEEKVTHTFVTNDNKGYVFIVSGVVAEDSIGSFFKLEEPEDAIVVYSEDRLRTNCKSLKYEYDSTLDVSRIDHCNSSSWVIKIDDNVYSSYAINLSNNIYGLSRKLE